MILLNVDYVQRHIYVEQKILIILQLVYFFHTIRFSESAQKYSENSKIEPKALT